ncbi:MAG: hypothetical protein K6E94_04590 [Elusimicrobiaceae bacterium]|nr:hypothetical protein [Elusimicrobiaceae bacterium]
MKIFINFLCIVLLTSVAFAKSDKSKFNKIPPKMSLPNIGAPSEPNNTKTPAINKTNKKETQSISFNNQTYYLAYSDGNQTIWLNEYLQKGEKLDSYKYMFSVRSYDTVTATPAQMVENMAKLYKQQNSLNEYQVFNGKGEDSCISFIMTQGNIVEFNLFRYTTVKDSPLALQFVYREYIQNGDHKSAMNKMAETAKTNLTTWKNEIINMPVPNIIRTPKN